jgi:hypothetical protein
VYVRFACDSIRKYIHMRMYIYICICIYTDKFIFMYEYTYAFAVVLHKCRDLSRASYADQCAYACVLRVCSMYCVYLYGACTCVCVCMCVCIIHTYIQIHTLWDSRNKLEILRHTYVHAFHTYGRLCLLVHAYIHTYIHRFVHACIHTYIKKIHTQVRTCIHTYMHTYIHRFV